MKKTFSGFETLTRLSADGNEGPEIFGSSKLLLFLNFNGIGEEAQSCVRD